MLVNVKPPELRLRVGRYRVRMYSKPDSIEVISVTDRSISYRE